jgi:hypothetical protein
MDRGCNIPSRESVQTSLWSFSAKAFEQPIKEVKQMTTETAGAHVSNPSVGATPDTPVAWYQINWRQAERTVRRLHTRIAQATQAGRWGKVKALQRLLTHSLSGKAEAPETSDGKHWQTNPRRPRDHLAHAGTEGGSHSHPQPTRIPSPTTTTSLHSEKQWCSQTALDPYYARQSHASPVLAGP